MADTVAVDIDEHGADSGLRILARIIARDWARRHGHKEYTEQWADDAVVNKKSPTEAVPAA